MPQKHSIKHPKEFVEAMVKHGLVPPNTQRIVIDINPEEAIIYWQMHADERLLRVLQDPTIRIEGLNVRIESIADEGEDKS